MLRFFCCFAHSCRQRSSARRAVQKCLKPEDTTSVFFLWTRIGFVPPLIKLSASEDIQSLNLHSRRNRRRATKKNCRVILAAAFAIRPSSPLVHFAATFMVGPPMGKGRKRDETALISSGYRKRVFQEGKGRDSPKVLRR